MATTDRLEISRLIHRFGFGPKPGEFAALVAGGVAKARQTVLTLPAVDAGDLAIVRGVGYPTPDLSHFTSMAIWQSASPDE